MSTERDTHFLGFAKLLWKDLLEVNAQVDMAGYIDMNNDDEPTKYLEIIAQRAYDLEQHILQHVNWYDPEESDIPDMTEWPK